MTVMEALSKAVEADDAAGAALIDCVVYDFMADLVEVNKQAINEVYSIWALDRVQIAKKALARSYVDTVSKGAYPNDDVHQAAQWLAGIERFITAASEVSKAGMNEWWEIGNRRVQRQVARDAQGRFTRGVNQNAQRAVSPVKRKDIASPLQSFTDGTQWVGGMTNENASRFQGRYEEALSFANDFKRSLGSNGNRADVVFMVQSPDGRIRNERTSLKDVSDKGIKMPGLRADDAILGVEVAPSAGASPQDAARIAEFNLLGGAGGSALAQLANTDPKLRSQLAQSLKMPNAAEDKSNLSRLFGILASGGAVLSGVGGADKIGQMAALVGTMGPQAEQVLGPYVKRSAYRYRGTETTPDPGLRDPQVAFDADQVKQLKRDFPVATKQSLEMHARADAASAILAETIPQDPIIARLSEASGQVLPSQGVIYDQNGKLVSQSVGFTDDHYLPFDLANLGRLRGGQYVRTRQQGGLTGEDIYTAVMSGARQVQVVSGSGVFTLEMAPDFRGARAMSDKARGMYDRYLKILDAVDGSGLYLEDITPQDKQKIFSDARTQLGDSADDAEVKALAEANIERARRDAQSVGPEDEEFAAENALREAGMQPRQGQTAAETAKLLRGRERRIYDDAFEENMNQIRSTKTNKLRLNAEGYSIALKTLQEQFPYFIADVKYREMDKMPTDRKQNLPKTRRYAQDQGYAQPGSLRAKNVQTGFYRPGDIEPKAKPQFGREVSTPSAPAETAPTTEVTTDTPTAQPQANQPKAAPVGVEGRTRDDRTLVPQLEKTATDLMGGMTSLGMARPMAARLNNSNLPFSSIPPTDRRAQAMWLLTQENPASVAAVMTSDMAMPAADAMSDREAVTSALSQIVANVEGYSDADEFFEANKLGGQNSLDGAVDWVMGESKKLADLGAMNKGLAPAPSKQSEILAHRGLMPLQMPGIAVIANKDEFKAFADNEQNTPLVDAAKLLAFDGDEHRSIADISSIATKRLDAMAKVASAQKAYRDQVQANPAKKVSDSDVKSFITPDEWKEASGQSSLPTLVEFANFNNDNQLTMEMQQAWSLAVTGRMIEVLDGGDVYPKVGSRLLEPIGKAVRQRTLVGPDGEPIRT